MRRFIFVIIVFASVPIVSIPSITAQDDENMESEAAIKAQQAHQLSESDMIYQQQDFKALYYQNIQIIELLQEIRDSLASIKASSTMTADKKTA